MSIFKGTLEELGSVTVLNIFGSVNIVMPKMIFAKRMYLRRSTE
jgi:TfoX/Sxy family transcriptional regulator of competence genes